MTPPLVSRHDVLRLARTCLPPPGHKPLVRWKHQGRLPATGLDCGGLVIWVAQELGLFDARVRRYRRDADGVSLDAACAEYLLPLPDLAAVRPGDVLSFDDGGRYPCHVAIVGDGATPFSLIHASALAHGVVEQRLDAWWLDQYRRAYAFPGVAPWDGPGPIGSHPLPELPRHRHCRREG